MLDMHFVLMRNVNAAISVLKPKKDDVDHYKL